MPANTFVATAEAVVLAGATPRFADVSPETLLLTPDHLEAAVTRHRPRAVIVVHLYGQMPDMDALCRAAARAGLAVIEDAAQAHGATWRGTRAGSFGTAGCFSFYPGKNLGAFGDAGAVVTADADLARRIRCLRDHGRAEGSHYRHERCRHKQPARRAPGGGADRQARQAGRLDAGAPARRRPVPG